MRKTTTAPLFCLLAFCAPVASAELLCLAPEWEAVGLTGSLFGPGADCSTSSSNPSPIYDPGPIHTIQVVVHLIQDSACVQGAISDQLVASQIAVLNEDFGALAGTPGAAGVDSGIRFALATTDPNGLPTTGITRHCNTTWFNDQTQVSPYYETIAWDPSRFLNLYSNSAAGSRGYVPFLPAASPAAVGTAADRVVINWQAFGRPGPVPAHAGGRTATHEIGHYFGLYHVYFGGCGQATPPSCYSTGDTLCDTPPDETSHQGCATASTSCGGVPIPAENYMELSDDSCLTGFTREQTRRMRCTLLSFRSGLLGSIFSDGFESGNAGAWSQSLP